MQNCIKIFRIFLKHNPCIPILILIYNWKINVDHKSCKIKTQVHGARHVLVATLSQQQFFMATMNCCNNFIATITTILKYIFWLFGKRFCDFLNKLSILGCTFMHLHAMYDCLYDKINKNKWKSELWKDFQITEWMISVLANIFLKKIEI